MEKCMIRRGEVKRDAVNLDRRNILEQNRRGIVKRAN